MTKQIKDDKSISGHARRVLDRHRTGISWIWLFILGALSISSVVSLRFKIVTGHGILIWLINALEEETTSRCLLGLCAKLYTFHGYAVASITAEALFEMARIIGLGSFFIGLVLNNLGKQESGFYYSELLSYLYPQYRVFLCLHIAGVLFAIWQAKVGYRESASLALFMVLLDFIPQWNALYFLVFSTAGRRELARIKWEKKFGRFSFPDNCPDFASSDITEFHELLCHLADTLAHCSGENYRKLVQCFSRALRKFSDLFSSQDITRYTGLLLLLKIVWEHLMCDNASNINAMDERRRLFLDMAKEMERTKVDKGDRNGSEGEIRIICLSYVLWLCQMYTVKGAKEYDDASMSMIALSNELAMMEYDGPFFTVGSMWRTYLESAYTILVWEHVLLRNIRLDDRLYWLQPADLPDKIHEMYWEAFIKAHFSTDYKDDAIRILPRVLEQIQFQIDEDRNASIQSSAGSYAGVPETDGASEKSPVKEPADTVV